MFGASISQHDKSTNNSPEHTSQDGKKMQTSGAKSSASPMASRFGGTAARRRRLAEPAGHVPGESKFESDPGLKNLLKEHTQLKMHQTKNWLKRKV